MTGDIGKEWRDVADMDPEELHLLRIAAIFGVVGTLVWAFGDFDKVLWFLWG